MSQCIAQLTWMTVVLKKLKNKQLAISKCELERFRGVFLKNPPYTAMKVVIKKCVLGVEIYLGYVTRKLIRRQHSLPAILTVNTARSVKREQQQNVQGSGLPSKICVNARCRIMEAFFHERRLPPPGIIILQINVTRDFASRHYLSSAGYTIDAARPSTEWRQYIIQDSSLPSCMSVEARCTSMEVVLYATLSLLPE